MKRKIHINVQPARIQINRKITISTGNNNSINYSISNNNYSLNNSSTLNKNYGSNNYSTSNKNHGSNNYFTSNKNHGSNNNFTSNIKHLQKNEADTSHAKKMPLNTLVRLSNCICRIKFGPKIGTGFFLKLMDGKNILHFLVSNEHIIEQQYINMKSELHFFTEKGKHYYLPYRYYSKIIRCFPKPTDITIVPIADFVINKVKDIDFLEMDLSWLNNRGFIQYLGEDVYCLQHPNNASTHIAMGKILKIFDSAEFVHSVDTDSGSSGSPIILCSNNKVVGIHKSGCEVNYTNLGTFIFKFLVDIIKQNPKLKKSK